jgi:hypothetical protein
MFVTEYKVIRVDFDSLENFLNNYYREFPQYHLYQILPEHCYDGAFAIVVLELDTEKGGE